MRLEQSKHLKGMIIKDLGAWCVVALLLLDNWIGMLTYGVLLMLMLGIGVVLLMMWDRIKVASDRQRHKQSWEAMAWNALDFVVVLSFMWHMAGPDLLQWILISLYIIINCAVIQLQTPKQEIED